MARYSVFLKGFSDNTAGAEKKFLDMFASSYNMSPDEAAKTVKGRNGLIYEFDDYAQVEQGKTFLESIGGIVEVRENKVVIPPPLPHQTQIGPTSPAATEETGVTGRSGSSLAPGTQSTQTAQHRSTGPVRVVFRPFAEIKFPKRCFACNIDNPPDIIYLSVMPATKASTGLTVGAVGGGLVGGLVGGIAGAAASRMTSEVQGYMLPTCEKCLARLGKKNKKNLGGSKDGRLFGTYEVDTPFLKREIIKKCVVLTFYNHDYGVAFKEANEGKLFDTIQDAKKSKPTSKAGRVEDVQARIKSILGDEPIAPMTPQTPEFENKIVEIIRATEQTDGVYVADQIPPEKLSNAVTACKAHPKDRFLGLIDCTVFGSGKYGLLFGTRGVHFPASKSGASPFDCVIFYKDLPSHSFLGGSKFNVPLTENEELDVSGATATKTDIVAVLESIKLLVSGFNPATREREIQKTGDPEKTGEEIVETGSDEFIVELKRILQFRRGKDGFYLKGSISQKKLKNALNKCDVPSDETILALIDLTVFGSAKNCLVFGEKGIYFHNDATGKTPGAFSVDYLEFRDGSFDKGGFQELYMGSDIYLNISGAKHGIKNEILDILNEIKKMV